MKETNREFPTQLNSMSLPGHMSPLGGENWDNTPVSVPIRIHDDSANMSSKGLDGAPYTYGRLCMRVSISRACARAHAGTGNRVQRSPDST